MHLVSKLRCRYILPYISDIALALVTYLLPSSNSLALFLAPLNCFTTTTTAGPTTGPWLAYMTSLRCHHFHPSNKHPVA